ncbi:hypothetical protein [Cupriavidus agavae]|uniref:Uncharacterized protein n=1 Tax=Cupriavidus agavae TaxID=1001822 RepID=A0A4Q7RYY6_9BURK|nr:hypothetical protein [Cupriavidus agavae]RZT39073.1 hypothetical protein EV147_2267 [Cupriavidus agavae]
MSKTTRTTPPETPDDTGASDPRSIPSTLDPNLDTENLDLELDDDLSDVEREGRGGTEDVLPEEEISEEVQRAAEELPADTPVDRADQTDKRMENPPNGSDL